MLLVAALILGACQFDDLGPYGFADTMRRLANSVSMGECGWPLLLLYATLTGTCNASLLRRAPRQLRQQQVYLDVGSQRPRACFCH